MYFIMIFTNVLYKAILYSLLINRIIFKDTLLELLSLHSNILCTVCSFVRNELTLEHSFNKITKSWNHEQYMRY